MSHVIKQVAGVPCDYSRVAGTKRAKTIGLLERSRALIKQSLRIDTSERRSLCNKYVSIAVVNCNTSYHSSISCELSRLFLGYNPKNVLDLKRNIRPQKVPAPNSQNAPEILEKTERIYQGVRKNTMQAHIECRAYHDKKINTSKLKESDYVHVLQLKEDPQGSKLLQTEYL